MTRTNLCRRLVVSLSVAGVLLLPIIVSAGVATAAETPSCPVSPSKTFSNPTKIDNRFLPLVPGTQLVLEGRSNRTGQPLPHRVVFTVTDLTKVINGVRTVVVHDTDTNSGQLVEAELAFFAQDTARNVWGLGEYPEEYEGGVFVGAPNTWIDGLEGAQGGIAMLADPRVGTPAYRQGFAPEIDFLDCAQVTQTGQAVCVPLTCYQNVLVTDEWSPLDPGSGHQLKSYAPGVGNIRVGAVNDPEGETLVLVQLKVLDARALGDVDRAAYALEGRAYRTSSLYRATQPMTRSPGSF